MAFCLRTMTRPFPCRLLLLPVFFPGGSAAPEVALGLVAVQDLPDAGIQRRIAGPQPLGQILVDGGF